MPCDHDHSQGQAHHHHHDLAGSRLGWAVALTVGFVVGESIAGWFGHSVALLSDAGHNLADALALLFSWYAIRAARRPSTATRTFGYHRVGIFAALVNAASLGAIAVLIVWEGVQRLLYPSPHIHAGVMIAVAAAAVIINAVIALSLHRHAHDDLNVRSAYLHMLGDAGSACAVIVAGIIVAVTGNPMADPVVSFVIAVLIMWSSWGILKESVNVLLEATPVGLDMCEVEGSIKAVPGVLDMHDLHVWTVGPGVVACSCHILVAEQTISSGQQVLRAVVAELRNRFSINHTTVQVEVEGCEPNDMYCTIRARERAHAGHHH
jgi:cobalt-zinc-cadmium efflux system protein